MASSFLLKHSSHKPYKVDGENSLFDSNLQGSSGKKAADSLHDQYLRERPLLEEIKMLRRQKEEAERRVAIAEQENRTLVRRVKDLEGEVVGLRKRASVTMDGIDTSTFGGVSRDHLISLKAEKTSARENAH